MSELDLFSFHFAGDESTYKNEPVVDTTLISKESSRNGVTFTNGERVYYKSTYTNNTKTPVIFKQFYNTSGSLAAIMMNDGYCIVHTECLSRE